MESLVSPSPKSLSGSYPLHVKTLARPWGIVADQVTVLVLLHPFKGFIEFLVPLYAQVLLLQGSVVPGAVTQFFCSCCPVRSIRHAACGTDLSSVRSKTENKGWWLTTRRPFCFAQVLQDPSYPPDLADNLGLAGPSGSLPAGVVADEPPTAVAILVHPLDDEGTGRADHIDTSIRAVGGRSVDEDGSALGECGRHRLAYDADDEAPLRTEAMSVKPLAGEGDVSPDGSTAGRQIANLDLASPSQSLGACGLIENLDEVPADFLPKPPGPFRSFLDSRGPLEWRIGLIKRHRLELKAEDAAEGFEGIQAG